MEMLDFFYETGLKRDKRLPRKLSLPPHSRLLLCGVRYCGKYSLMQEHLKEKEDVLFIDMEDFRFDYETYKKEIDEFIKQRGIKHLALYSYQKGTYLPECENILLCSHKNIEIEGYEKAVLDPLDFEEFILFDRGKDIKVTFNSFLKSGNYPELALLPESKKERRAQEIFKLSVECDIFKELAFFQSVPVSAHFVYNRLRQKIKISKDRFYEYFTSLIKDRYIFAIERFGSKRAAKKLFFHNFLTKSYFYTQKEFPKLFENMVFLEMKDENLFYMEPLGFFNPDTEIVTIAIPFGNEVRIENKIDKILSKNRINPKKIEVVSVASSFEYRHKTIPCEVVPFYEWAVRG